MCFILCYYNCEHSVKVKIVTVQTQIIICNIDESPQRHTMRAPT